MKKKNEYSYSLYSFSEHRMSFPLIVALHACNSKPAAERKGGMQIMLIKKYVIL